VQRDVGAVAGRVETCCGATSEVNGEVVTAYALRAADGAGDATRDCVVEVGVSELRARVLSVSEGEGEEALAPPPGARHVVKCKKRAIEALHVPWKTF